MLQIAEQSRSPAGLEPHSILPVAIPAVMNTLSDQLPQACQTCHSLATSIVFALPFVRQIWWWLDIRPATRKNFNGLLKDGKTVCLTPGGIQECLYMRPGHEVAYLTQRLGFIRIALRHGYVAAVLIPLLAYYFGHFIVLTGACVCSAPLVPAFAFGQCDMYKYVKPGPPIVPKSVIAALSRKVGFVPFLFWGWCGTTIPYDSAMTVVLGDPISTIEDQTEEPTDELCKRYNQKFIANLHEMFEEHKAEAGYPDLELHVM